MSQRLRDCFARGREEGRPLFVAYVTAGYPAPAQTVDILLGLEAGGADVIELGVPFTDPLADGATIQHANQVALDAGVTFRRCLDLVSEARAKGLQAPVLFMGYYNPLLAFGEARAVAAAAAAGADGFIVIDLPPDEAATFLDACRANDMSFVPLVAPTTTDERMGAVMAVGDAFVYCVSVTGTTGGRSANPAELAAFMARVRAKTDLPVGVGFGISTRAHVEAVSAIADAAIVGTAIITRIDTAGAGHAPEAVRAFAAELTGRAAS